MELSIKPTFRIFTFLLLFSFLFIESVGAVYLGPNVIITEKFGKDNNEIGLDGDDPYDDFAKVIKINKNGTIFVADKVNKRVKVYKENSVLESVITPHDIEANYYWPQLMACDSEDNIYVSSYESELQKYSIDSKLIWSKNIHVNSIINIDNLIVVVSKEKTPNNQNAKYVCYDLAGQLIWVKENRPKMLGVSNSRRIAYDKYQTNVSFPDISYKIRGFFSDFSLGCGKELYAISIKTVHKFNEYGKLIGDFTIPKDQRKVIRPAGKGMEEISEMVAKYGQPVIAPNGDVYCWKRTPDTYSILKWVWTDGPDAPVVTSVSPSKDGLKVSWQPPAQNAEEVEGYEVVRSTEVCGPFKPIESVAKNVLQYEDKKVEKDVSYYYKIRASKKSVYSGYSNKAVGMME